MLSIAKTVVLKTACSNTSKESNRMRKSRSIGATVAAAGTLLAMTGVATAGPVLAAKSSGRPVVHFPAHLPGVKSNACFWGTSYAEETRNIIWPESHTDYPVSTDSIPAGGKIVLHGRFPHARFFSFTITSPILQLRNYLYDVNIKPDKGSTNPFLPGANRDATHRSYTVTIVDQPDPGLGHRQPNTLYAGVAGQTSAPFVLGERVYLPDKGRDFTGGVGDPTASYVASDGTTSTGQAACTALQTKPGAYNLLNVNPILFPESKIKQLLTMSNSPEHPATDHAVWYKYFGPTWLLAPYYAGTADASMVSQLPLTTTGLGANPANGYVFTWLDRRFGPDHNGHNIAVLRGKLPTTPATYLGESRMQSGYATALLVAVQQRRPPQRRHHRPMPGRRGDADQRSPRLHDRAQPAAGPADQRDRQMRRGVDELRHEGRRLHPAGLHAAHHAQPRHDCAYGVPALRAGRRVAVGSQADDGGLPPHRDLHDGRAVREVGLQGELTDASDDQR